MKNLKVEFQKFHRRHMWLLFFLSFALICAWMLWCVKDLDLTKLNSTTAMLEINLLLMNTIVTPLVLATTASRMCDMEQVGNTYTWIFTMQSPGSFFKSKLLAGLLYLLVFDLLQTVLLVALDQRYQSGWQKYYFQFFVTVIFTHVFLFLFQLLMSLHYENQLFPLFISIGGTFAGVFSWFLPQIPLRYVIPWGYFVALCNSGYNYDEATRYTEYFWEPYPLLWLFVCALCICLLYYFGKKRFCRKIAAM